MRQGLNGLWSERAGVAACLLACLSFSAAPADALQIDGYSAVNNNFTFGAPGTGTYTANPGFFANGYDLTGIAINGAGILISPHYIVSEWHAGTAGNPEFINKDGKIIQTFVQDSIRLTTNGAGSDLRISRLYDNQGITPADGVSYYPIVVKKNASGGLDYSWYVGQKLLNFGTANVTGETAGIVGGTNTIDSTWQASFGGGDSPTEVADFHYNATTPYQNQCGLVGGDSGYPVGMIVDGQLTALGANMGAYGWDASGSWSSVCSFLPYYVDQINAYMAQGDTGEQVTVIPEPATLGLLIVGGLLLPGGRRRAAGSRWALMEKGV